MYKVIKAFEKSVCCSLMLWVSCSSSCFECSGWYITMIDQQTIQSYPKHLSFYGTPLHLSSPPSFGVSIAGR